MVGAELTLDFMARSSGVGMLTDGQSYFKEEQQFGRFKQELPESLKQYPFKLGSKPLPVNICNGFLQEGS
jgi:hypothetical protein